MNLNRTNYSSEEEISLTSSTLSSPQFPIRLHDMLDQAESQGYQHIVSWLPEGNSFQIHDPESMLPILQHAGFNQRVWKSFLRQLQNYGFCREVKGPDKGKCTHALFIRGRRDLSLAMRRIKRSGSGESLASSKKTRSLGEYPERMLESGNDSFNSLANSSFSTSSSHGLSFPSMHSLGRTSFGSRSSLSQYDMASYSNQVSSNRNATFKFTPTSDLTPLRLPKSRADATGSTSRKLLGTNATDSEQLIWEIQNELARLRSGTSMIQKPTIPPNQPTGADGLISGLCVRPLNARYKPELDARLFSPMEEMCVDASEEYMSRIFLNEPTLEELYDPK